jgi:hypothetical protein
VFRTAVFSSILTLIACAAEAMPVSRPSPPTAVTTVHGCHGYYSHDMKGWHRHAKNCETQRGLARNKRDKKRSI